MVAVSADSPISDAALEELAGRVAGAFRLVRARAPREVQREVRETLEQVFSTVEAGSSAVRGRVALARELERLDAELRGRVAFVPYFYGDGRLAVVRAFHPIRIREAVDDQWVRAHLRRYGERIDRADRRLRWFQERCGVEVEEAAKRPAWELPYASFEEYHELIWGKMARPTGGPR